MHIEVKGEATQPKFIRVKMENKFWNSQHYGVNPPIKVIQNRNIVNLYFEPTSEWKGKTFNVYFIYEGGTVSSINVPTLEE